MSKKYSVTFVNESDLPVMVEGWKEIMVGLNQIHTVLVLPGEESTVSCITGEWFVTTFFNESRYHNQWAIKKLQNLREIGKFRINPCAYGDYSWMDTDKFDITREEGDIFRFNYSKPN